MLEKEGKVSNCPTLVNALEEVYGPYVFETPEFALFKLVQEDSVANYYATFLALPNRVEGVSPSTMLKCFISGLRREIQRDIIPLLPESISKAASLAKLYEDKYPALPKANFKRGQFIPDINANSQSGRVTIPLSIQKLLPPPQNVPQLMPPNPSNSSPTFKKISFNEMQLRKAKGLCFNCDEKYSPTHKCWNKRLLMLQWGEELSDDSE